MTGGDTCQGHTFLERIIPAINRVSSEFPKYQFYVSAPGDQICGIYFPGNVRKVQHAPDQNSLERLLIHADKISLDVILTHEKSINLHKTILGNTDKINLKPIPSLRRLALLAVFPTQFEGEYTLVLDVGANSKNKPVELEQYAYLGRIAARHLFGIPNPTVALCNIGEEPYLGEQELRGLYKKLAAQDINFIGFVEPDHIFGNEGHMYNGQEYWHPDVAVIGGDRGNWGLKMAEATAVVAVKVGKQEFFRKIMPLVSAGINYMRMAINIPLNGRPALKIKKRLSPGEYGGAIMPGIRTKDGRDMLLIKGHGSAVSGIYSGLVRAVNCCESGLASKINSELETALLKTDTVTSGMRRRIDEQEITDTKNTEKLNAPNRI